MAAANPRIRTGAENSIRRFFMMIPPLGLEPAWGDALLKRRRTQMPTGVNETRRESCVNWYPFEKKRVQGAL
jgi:hypothetical protein